MNKAFTLIELLVVVTIIVVLLALLVPAMDQAIYQTELAMCATKQHTIAVGAMAYANDSKRRYPYRPSKSTNASFRAVDTYFGSWGPTAQGDAVDDRVVLRTFISINNALNCPLVKRADFENSDVDSSTPVPYALYFGYGYKSSGKGVFKLGDRLVNDDPLYGASVSVNLLVSDWDGIYDHVNEPEVAPIATHPDRQGMSPYFLQDEDYATGTEGATKATFSYWATTGPRGVIDSNYAYDDGSVRRIEGVAWNEGKAALGNDNRMVWLPQHEENNKTDWKLQLPRH